MEGNKKLYAILIGISVALLTAAYGVGYYVGSSSGYEKAKKEFAVEKQKLLKTIASLTPLSRPKPEEKVVVVNNESTPKKEDQVKVASNKQVKQQEQTKKAKKPEKTKVAKATKPTKEKPTTKAPKKETVKKEKNTSKTEAATKKDYYIQLGVFSKKENAEKLAVKLAKADIPAHVKKIGKFYKVTAGMFTKEEAHKTLQKLKKMKIEGIIKRR